MNRLILIFVVAVFGFAQAPAGRGPSPEQLAIQQGSQEDRQKMLEQLHISAPRPGANARQPGSANYDEAKANPYPELPEPLVLKNGKKVTSAKV